MQPGDCSTATTPNGSACVKGTGRRLFQFRDHDGNVRQVTARDVNRFLREIAGVEISLKDFRTLFAFVSVLEALAPAEPATSQRARRRQALDAIRALRMRSATRLQSAARVMCTRQSSPHSSKGRSSSSPICCAARKSGYGFESATSNQS
jgi:hypothetical protein